MTAAAGVTQEREPVLEVDRLTIGSRHRDLVHRISFTLRAGERVGLIGESGSGKSLTSLAVMGLLPVNLHSRGSIRLLESSTEIVGATDRRLSRLRGARLGMVFQEPMTALNPTMRVGAQVAEVVLRHKKATSRAAAKDRAIDILREVRLPEPERLYRAYPHELSGGQRQRVVLAIAMANRPAVLICDEPTTALDVTVQKQMLDLIVERVEADGAALLFITHDLAVVAGVCERIIVMYDGEMLEAGAAAQVLRSPRHPYTRELIGASDLSQVDERGHVPTLSPGLFEYRARIDRCPYCTAAVRDQDGPHERSRWIGDVDHGYACFHEGVS